MVVVTFSRASQPEEPTAYSLQPTAKSKERGGRICWLSAVAVGCRLPPCGIQPAIVCCTVIASRLRDNAMRVSTDNQDSPL
jgi:hypothetical protein